MSNIDRSLTQQEWPAALRSSLLARGYSPERADSIVHALADITESSSKIYQTLLPALIDSRNASSDDFKDRLWDIREEFRHIQYHIEDGKLTEL